MAQCNFDAIGTRWQIDIYQELTELQESDILARVKNRIDIFDKTYSRFRADSLVTKMSKETGTFELPPDAEKLFSVYRDIYDHTGGLVTPLIGNLISDAGYDANYSLQRKEQLAAPMTWEEAIEYKAPNLMVKKPVLLDFGAAGKGYLIDLVGEILEGQGFTSYCIDAGGDILYKNNDAIRVGLENPDDTSQVVGVYTLKSGSICGSAGNRRTWGEFTHIINPKTLISPVDISAVWVIAETALIADALTTCLFFIDPKSLTERYTFEYLILKKDHSIEKSESFSGELFQ